MHPRIALPIVFLALLSPSLVGGEHDSVTDVEPTSMTFPAKTAPLLIFQQRLLTRVSVADGDEQWFMIDNGCYYTAVEPELAAGSDYLSVSNKQVNSAGKRGVLLDIGRLSAMRIGELELRDELVTVSPLIQEISRRINHRIHGIVGMYTFSRFLTTIDFASGQIIFRPNEPEARRQIMSQPGTIVALRCKPSLISRTNAHLFAIEMEINGVAVDAIVDLGFSGGIITNFDPEELNLDRYMKEERIAIAIAGLVGEGHQTWARSVVIVGHRIDGVEAIWVDAPQAPRLVIVGVDFLKRFEVTFDYENDELILRQRPS